MELEKYNKKYCFLQLGANFLKSHAVQSTKSDGLSTIDNYDLLSLSRQLH